MKGPNKDLKVVLIGRNLKYREEEKMKEAVNTKKMYSCHKYVITIMLSLFLFSPCVISQAKEKDDKEKKAQVKKAEESAVISKKQVVGTVSSINMQSISVAYSDDQSKGIMHEMLLNLDENIAVQRKKNLKEIKEGDMVRVTFEEAVIEIDGKQKFRRIAKIVSFVKAAPKPKEIIRFELK
jgi:hypothetical protein